MWTYIADVLELLLQPVDILFWNYGMCFLDWPDPKYSWYFPCGSASLYSEVLLFYCLKSEPALKYLFKLSQYRRLL